MPSAAERRPVWILGHPWQQMPDATEANGPDPYGGETHEWLDIDWREHLRTVQLGSTRVNYAELGSGPALLFVHGLGGAWQNWLENIPHFARTHRVIALDLPGFGDSPLPEWTLNIRNYGSMVLDFCAAVETGPVAVVGNSMGGFVAAEISIRSDPLVEKIALVSSAGVTHARMYKRPAATAGRMAAAMAPLAFRVHRQALLRPRLRHLAVRNLFHNPSALPREMIAEVMRTGLNATGIAQALHGLAGYDILDRLEEVKDPTLIVWGRQDLVVPPIDALAYHERLPHARLEIFDHCGHLPMAERPVRFNRVLEEFLAADRA